MDPGSHLDKLGSVCEQGAVQNPDQRHQGLPVVVPVCLHEAKRPTHPQQQRQAPVAPHGSLLLAFLILLARRLRTVSGRQGLFIYVVSLVNEGIGDEEGLREGDRKCHYVPMAAAEPCVVRISVEHERLEAEHLEEPLVVHLPGVEY